MVGEGHWPFIYPLRFLYPSGFIRTEYVIW